MTAKVQDIYPLSPMQAGVLFHSLYQRDSDVYLGQYRGNVKGDLDVEAFRCAWSCLVERHTALRTSFVWKDHEEPLQVVWDCAEMPFHIEDLRTLEPPAREARCLELEAAEWKRGFDLESAPLIRVTLLRLEDSVYRLIWMHHHIVLDGWCLSVLMTELLAAYESFSRGEPPQLPPAPPFSEYIGWLDQQDYAAAEQYWRKTLEGITQPGRLVPASRAATERVRSDVYAEHRISLSPAVTAQVHAAARACRVTLNTVVQGAWAVLLNRYTGSSDVLFGVAVSGRPPAMPGVDRIIGNFVNTIVARVPVLEKTAVADWLQDLQQQQAEARQYEWTPLASIQKWADVPNGEPLFDSIVVFESYPSIELSEQRRRVFDIESFPYTGRTNYPLSLVVAPRGDLSLTLIFNQELLDTDAARRMMAHLEELLETMSYNPHAALGDIVLLDVRPFAAKVVPVTKGSQWAPGLAATDLEATLSRIWAGVFGHASVSIDDDFFDLGGDSILSLQIVSRAEQAGIELTPRDIFDYPTIRSLVTRSVPAQKAAAAVADNSFGWSADDLSSIAAAISRSQQGGEEK